MPEPAPVIIAILSLTLIRNIPARSIGKNPSRSSIGSAAPAHVVTLAGNKTRIIRRQKVNDRSDLFWPAGAAHGNSAGHVFNLLRSDLLEDRSVDHRRRHTIDMHS